MTAVAQARRILLGRRWAWILGTRLGRYLLRRQIARKRARLMRVVGGVTIGAMLVLVLLAEREAARQTKRWPVRR